jgi:hypothetical protein
MRSVTRRRRITFRRNHPESGQTILLVALAIVSLLGMAALAIDVVTLYVARTEIQRAADAAALAGAKAIADSAVTSLDASSPNLSAAQTLAQNMATAAVTALITASPPINPVAGAAPTLVTVTPIPVDFTHQGNPRITIALVRTNLPTFFSKIFGRSAASVTATATAEVYNPANLGTFTPISPTSVKPWLVANSDPTGTAPKFVDTTTWIVDSGVIGKNFDLVSDCGSDPTDCLPLNHDPPAKIGGTTQVEYVPAAVTIPNTANVCPQVCGGATDYEQAIECADVSTSYQVLSCGGGAAQAQWDHTVTPGPPPGNNATTLGGVCLIHASTTGFGKGQDLLQDPGPWPAAPFQYKSQSGLQNGNLVSTSSSVVTIPILDTTSFSSGTPNVTIVGFLQAFINQINDGTGVAPVGSVNITVLNIAGCSTTPNASAPVVGGAGTSPVPVRLITPP